MRPAARTCWLGRAGLRAGPALPGAAPHSSPLTPRSRHKAGAITRSGGQLGRPARNLAVLVLLCREGLEEQGRDSDQEYNCN